MTGDFDSVLCLIHPYGRPDVPYLRGIGKLLREELPTTKILLFFSKNWAWSRPCNDTEYEVAPQLRESAEQIAEVLLPFKGLPTYIVGISQVNFFENSF